MEYEREIKKKKGLNAITGESREGGDWFETSNKEKKKKNTDLSKKKKRTIKQNNSKKKKKKTAEAS